MARHKLKYTPEQVISTYRAHGNNMHAASMALGCGPTTMKRYLERAGIDTSFGAGITEESPTVGLPEFPDDDIPVDEIRSLMAKRFEKRQAHQKAKEWYRVKVNLD